MFCSSPCVWKPHSKAGFSGWKADAKMECLPQQVVLGRSHSRKRHSKNLNAIHHCSFLYSILYVPQSLAIRVSKCNAFFCQVAPLHQRNKALIAAIHAGGHDFKLLPQLLGAKAKVQNGWSPSGGLDVRYDYGSTKSIQCVSFRIIPLVLPMIKSIRKNNSELSTGHQTVRMDSVDSDPASAVTGSSFCHVAVNASL